MTIEERAKNMTAAEVDMVWKAMENGIPYVSAEARESAWNMIKELKHIAQRKHDEELALDG